jgi:hypothetical protein
MDKCTTAAIQYLPTLVSGMHNWKTHLKFNDLAFEFTQAHETSNTNQNNLRADLKFAGWQCQLLTTLNNMAYMPVQHFFKMFLVHSSKFGCKCPQWA